MGCPSGSVRGPAKRLETQSPLMMKRREVQRLPLLTTTLKKKKRRRKRKRKKRRKKKNKLINLSPTLTKPKRLIKSSPPLYHQKNDNNTEYHPQNLRNQKTKAKDQKMKRKKNALIHTFPPC